MKCPNCSQEMEAGYVTFGNGSSVIWYRSDEPQHIWAPVRGGEALVKMVTKSQYLQSSRCQKCNIITMKLQEQKDYIDTIHC
jgi:hypothetical protein